MYAPSRQGLTARMFRVAALAGVAFPLGGCIHSILGPVREFEDFAYDYEIKAEQGIVPRARPHPAPAAAPSFTATFHDRLAHRIDDKGHQPAHSDLNEHLAMTGQPAAYGMTADPDQGMLGDELQREITEEVGQEFRRLCRRAMVDSIRQQPVFRKIRGVVSIDSGDEPAFGYGGSLRSPRKDDDEYGTRRRLNGESPGVRAPDPSEFKGSLSLGVRPRMGFKWMRMYRFAWDPSDEEFVHRLGYGFGRMGVETEYRIEEGEPSMAGVGMSYRPDPMLLFTLSASKGLQDVEPHNDESVLLSAYYRF